jgi:general stress protein CsbA
MPQLKRILKIDILQWVLGGIIVIAPFYATFAVWLSSWMHHFDFLRIWKELALFAAALAIAGLLIANRYFTRNILRQPLLILCFAYIFWMLATGIYALAAHQVSSDAFVYGLLIDGRLIAIFLVAFITFSQISKSKANNFPWRKIIFWPALLVVVFGFLQMFVLPKDFLAHFGYSQSTIVPYQTVDNQPGIVRVQSTTRGPNPLGAYLLVIIALITAIFFSVKGRPKILWGLFGVVSAIVLFGSYSRSAEVGLILTWAVLLVAMNKKFLTKHWIAAGIAAAIGIGILIVFRSTYLVQNVLFHTSSKSTAIVSSNTERATALHNGVNDLIHDPLGGGVGTAGPASLRNKDGNVRIAENYYLQLGQEMGVIGIALFAAINIRVAVLLWRNRQYLLSRALLASLVGLTFVNMVSHAWSDDTLAYVWWGLAGIAIAQHISKRKPKKASA